MDEFNISISPSMQSISFNYKSIPEICIDTCLICLKNTPLHSLDLCHHAFCDSCLVLYLELKISEAQVDDLLCPICSSIISEALIQSLISEKSFKKYKDFQKIKKLELNLYVKFCPVPDCKGFDIANENNSNLTCNLCEHKYCYYCSQEWHKGRCKDNTEFSFKLWAYANNLKICPRCKNHVQKNGGCPKMSCPRCHFQWCWRCGKNELIGPHNSFNCMIGESWFDIYWTNILLLLLLPLLFPFLSSLALIFLSYSELKLSILNKIYGAIWSQLIFYFVLFLLAPILIL